jgi:hypothetical protein
MTTRAKTTTWHGKPSELRDLLTAVQRHCSCVYAQGACTSVCAGHRLLVEDQRALDGLLFVRRLADRLRREEELDTGPLAAPASNTDQPMPSSTAQRGHSRQPDALEPSAPLARSRWVWGPAQEAGSGVNRPSTCSACAFVSAQLGSAARCPWHAGLDYVSAGAADPAAPCLSARPTADQPWPFTTREYARLLLLRGRVQEWRLAPPSAGTPDGLGAP